ncbi:Hypothetical Protein FCC1311_090232 [Hondaea fermentalgiana]|uniref:Ubiquitin-like domain-containing protein n=1 Tax=Hondaea fermentalgiana TaxID=2315210 RepID=A0A2R5GSR1_9STRA|nr:Hypothetical Protein FCC1311_090232 [Hondaea fermentalgiana]|eukprot:GBG32798.1 Hypothetical Protein FCC1311_090232 [Hondaea fermentalgiana]
MSASSSASSGNDARGDRDITLVVMHPYYPKPVRLPWKVTEDGTVGDIKTLLEKEHPWKPPVTDQKIIFHGRYLANEELVHVVFARWPTDDTMTLHLVTTPPPSPADPQEENTLDQSASSSASQNERPTSSGDVTASENTHDALNESAAAGAAAGAAATATATSRTAAEGFGQFGSTVYEHTQNFGEVATLAGLAGSGVHSASAPAPTHAAEPVDNARRPPFRAPPYVQGPMEQQFHFQQQMLHEMGLDASLLNWSAFDPRQLERTLGGGSSTLAWFNEETDDENPDFPPQYAASAAAAAAAVAAAAAAAAEEDFAFDDGIWATSESASRSQRQHPASRAQTASTRSDRVTTAATDARGHASDDPFTALNDIGDDNVEDHDDEACGHREPQSYQECIESLDYHYKKLMRAIQVSQRLQAAAAMRFVPMQMANETAHYRQYQQYQQGQRARGAGSAGLYANPLSSRGGRRPDIFGHGRAEEDEEEDAASILRRARLYAARRANEDENEIDAGPGSENESQAGARGALGHAARDRVHGPNNDTGDDLDNDNGNAANQAGPIPRPMGQGGRPADVARAPAFQRVIVINLQLLIKLGLAIYFLNNDTSSIQFYVMLFGAALVYLYETGYLEPLIGTREQQIAFFQQQRLHEIGHIDTVEQVPNGLLVDAYYFVKAFILSVVPSWTVVPRAVPLAAADAAGDANVAGVDPANPVAAAAGAAAN